MAFICLFLGALIKFLILPLILDYFSIYIGDIGQYFITGILVGVARLALRGIVEDIFSEYLPQTTSMGGDGSYSSSSSPSSQIMTMDTNSPNPNQSSSSSSGQSFTSRGLKVVPSSEKLFPTGTQVAISD
jgi:hypothetical protein